VFAALMGPGFSVLLALACVVPEFLGWPSAKVFLAIGALTTVLNAFNMIPVEPLDGGVALRSIMTRLTGGRAWSGLVAIGLLTIGFGFASGQIVYVIFGLMAVLANLWRRTIDFGLLPLSSLQLCISFFGYAAITGAHLSMMDWFLRQLGL
jgi:Zn-dependent protease